MIENNDTCGQYSRAIFHSKTGQFSSENTKNIRTLGCCKLDRWSLQLSPDPYNWEKGARCNAALSSNLRALQLKPLTYC